MHNAVVAILTVILTDRYCLRSPGQVDPLPATGVTHARNAGGLAFRLPEHEVKSTAMAGTNWLACRGAIIVVSISITSCPVEEERHLCIHHTCKT